MRAGRRALLALERAALLTADARDARLAGRAVLGVLPETTEDHLAGGGLQHARHGDVGVLADHAARVVHDDHRPVVEVGDALVVLLPFLQDEDAHRLARQHHGLERVRQLVDVQHLDAVELRHLVEVKVVGDDNAVERLREFEELEVNLLDGGEVRVNDLDVERGVRLQAVEHVEAAAAPLAFGRVGRVGHLLKLAEDELRDDDCAGEEARLGHVGDAAVNDDRGVEYLHVLARHLVAENAAQCREVEVVALRRADH